VHYRRGEYQTALGHLEAAVEGLPEHPLVRYHLAMTYAALERHEDAKAQFAKAAELVDEGDPAASNQLKCQRKWIRRRGPQPSLQ
jgi:Flp pilus assembly protein TadD